MKSLVVILAAAAFAQVVAATGLTADFTVEKSDFRRALHSSGFAPRITSFGETFNDVKSLNFEYAARMTSLSSMPVSVFLTYTSCSP